MKLKKCENGHFYDESKYAFCPHCKNNGGRNEVDYTVAMYSSESGNAKKMEQALTEPLTQATESQSIGNREMKASNEVMRNTDMNYAELQKEVFALQAQEQNPTVGYYSQKMELNPVVGWLVCLSGKNRGRSYELHAGRNFVGRTSDMDIMLEGDNSVSRVKHAIFVYDARGKKYIAQPGESRELFYVNEEVVLNNVAIKSFDKILIGHTQLLFIALCGENFTWDE